MKIFITGTVAPVELLRAWVSAFPQCHVSNLHATACCTNCCLSPAFWVRSHPGKCKASSEHKQRRRMQAGTQLVWPRTAGFPKGLLDCTRLTSVPLVNSLGAVGLGSSVGDLVSFGSLPGEFSRLSALRQLRIRFCDVREFVGIHRLTSLESLQGTRCTVNRMQKNSSHVWLLILFSIPSMLH